MPATTTRPRGRRAPAKTTDQPPANEGTGSPKATRASTATQPPVEPPADENQELTPAEARKQRREQQRQEDSFTRRVRAASTKAVVGIIEAGAVLVGAQDKMGKGTWTVWVETNLKWTLRTAERFQKIGAHEPYRGKNVQQSLPASWGTLYALTALTPDELTTAIEKGEITPAMPRSAATALVKKLHPKPVLEPEDEGDGGDPEPEAGDAIEGATVKAIEGGDLAPLSEKLRKAIVATREMSAVLDAMALAMVDNDVLLANPELATEAADHLYDLVAMIAGHDTVRAYLASQAAQAA